MRKYSKISQLNKNKHGQKKKVSLTEVYVKPLCIAHTGQPHKHRSEIHKILPFFDI